MLEIYKQNQQAAEEAAKAKSSINAIPVKTYPLAFNAYNMDTNYGIATAIVNPTSANANNANITKNNSNNDTSATSNTATSTSTDLVQSLEDKNEFIKKLFD